MDRGQAGDREPGADRDDGAAQAGGQADSASAHDPVWSAWDSQIQWDEWPAQQPAVGPWSKPRFDLGRIGPENIRVRLYSAREPQPRREPDPNRPGYYKDGWLIAVRDRYDREVAAERARAARDREARRPRWRRAWSRWRGHVGSWWQTRTRYWRGYPDDPRSGLGWWIYGWFRSWAWRCSHCRRTWAHPRRRVVRSRRQREPRAGSCPR
jgi:hypothetical protein